MNRRLKGYALAATVVAAVLLIASTMSTSNSGDRLPPSRRAAAEAAASPGVPSPLETPEVASFGGESTDMRTYAIAVSELQGLPPDAAPGTRFELWVAWDPPITKEPEAGLLLEMVELEKIVPPVTPDGPAAAILRVPADHIRDLMYSDRYGAFAVAVLP